MGTIWPLSNQMVWDNHGNISPGAQAFFYEAGTTTPLVVFMTFDEATEHPIPVLADGDGRWPAVFVPYGPYKTATFTSRGVQIGVTIDNIPNPDPHAEVITVNQTSLLNTGDIFFSFVDGTRDGAVRCNGKTIGNISSAASERSNDDTENLFVLLWDNVLDSGAPVLPGGRGASAADDYAANKTIGVPDLRGAVPLGLPTMGGTNNGTLATTPVVTGSAIQPGSIIGENTHVLLTAEIGGHTHPMSFNSVDESTHTHGVNINSGTQNANHSHALGVTSTASTTSSGEHVHSGTATNAGIDHTHSYSVTNFGLFSPTGGSTNFGANTSASNTGNASAYLHTHPVDIPSSGTHSHPLTGSTAIETATHAHNVSGTSGSGLAHHHLISGTTDNNTSGDGAHNTVSRGTVGTWFIKL